MNRFVAAPPADLPEIETILSMSGLDFMRGVRDGRLPAPPIAGPLNFWLDTVEAGRVLFRGAPRFDSRNLAGSVHGGWYGTLLDSCMACAVMTVVPKGQLYTTLEYDAGIRRWNTR